MPRTTCPVWLPEDPQAVQPRPIPTLAGESQPSASHRNPSDTLWALNDQIDPANSIDPSIPRFTWWDHCGTKEWVQYDFNAPKTVRGVEVFWFDDTGRGQCRPPRSWRILARGTESWRELSPPRSGVLNQFDRIELTPHAKQIGALRVGAEAAAV